MKKMLIIGGMIAALLITTLTAYAGDMGTARISFIRGDVLVSTGDIGDEWAAASINMPLMPGDRLWVPYEGRTEIQFAGRTYLRADGNTEITITRTKRDGDARIIQTALPEGRVYVNYRSPAGRESTLQVDTPLVSVMAYENSQFDIEVREDGYTEVSVFGGAVYVEAPKGSTRITRGNMISIGPEDYAQISPLGISGEWIKWNQSRDYQLSRAISSSRYLPPELQGYSSDFDQYGRWTYVRDYGYVWNPTIVISGWAPYRQGRWLWMRGDYVWISYEPWGWAPYHYGRWAFRVGIGWFWVPPVRGSVFWAPGYVAWIYTPTYISWVPLAPRETYYGYGHYGPYSVNLVNVNIKNVNVTNVYVNSRVTNAVTVIHRDTFLTGRHVKFEGIPGNPFEKGARVSPGRPDIKPEKTTLIPLPEKDIPQRALPPQRVHEKVKKAGMHERPVATTRDASVFKQGKPADPMPVVRGDKPKPAPRSEMRQRGEMPAPQQDIQPAPDRARPQRPDADPKDPGKGKGPAERQKFNERQNERRGTEQLPQKTPGRSSGLYQLNEKNVESAGLRPAIEEAQEAMPRERRAGLNIPQRVLNRSVSQKYGNATVITEENKNGSDDNSGRTALKGRSNDIARVNHPEDEYVKQTGVKIQVAKAGKISRPQRRGDEEAAADEARQIARDFPQPAKGRELFGKQEAKLRGTP